MPIGNHSAQRKVNEAVQEAVLQRPQAHRFKHFLDKFVYFTGACSVLFSIPQVLQIWIDHNAAGVSLVTWLAFTFNATVWTMYGITHKQKQIIVMYSMFIVIDMLVVSGIFLYG